MEERKTSKFCPHIVGATEAFSRNQFATTANVNIEKLISKVSDEILEKSFMNESYDGEVTIFELPNRYYAVPMLDIFSPTQSEDFVHVSDLKCSLDICTKKTKSKKHALGRKEVPICPHSMLGG